MPLPAPAPSNAVENLGPQKVDLDRAPDDTHYLKASEWNWAVEYIKRLWAAVDTLLVAGSTLELQGAYDNAAIGANFNPVRLTLSPVLRRIIVTDATPPLAELLFGVSRADGSDEYGFWAHGLRLQNGADAIHSPLNVAVRMRSAQSPLNGPAFILDTNTTYTVNSKILSLRTAGLEMYGFGAVGQFLVQDPLSPPGTVLYGFVPRFDTTGAIHGLSSLPGGFSLLPQAAGVGKLGYDILPWRAVYARQHATSRTNFTAAAGVIAVDMLNGEIARIELAGDVDVGIIDQEQGAQLTLVFIQDGTGGWKVNFITPIKLNRRFGVTPAANAVDSITLRYTGVEWVEVGRQQQAAPEHSMVGPITLAGGIMPFVAHFDAHLVEFNGVLGAAQTLEFDPASGSNGDRFELMFDDVVTTVVNTLTIKNIGGGTLLNLNQNKTLTGRLLLYHDGVEWRLSPVILSTIYV